jgi:DNA-binding transcriptional regulator/RsmH inhibitor MraZ
LNITNEISFVGVGEKIELWNSIELAKYEKEMVKKYSEISDSITEEGGSRKS